MRNYYFFQLTNKSTSVFDKKGTTKQEDVVNIEKLYSKIGEVRNGKRFLNKTQST